jgi:hypothetical protein
MSICINFIVESPPIPLPDGSFDSAKYWHNILTIVWSEMKKPEDIIIFFGEKMLSCECKEYIPIA